MAKVDEQIKKLEREKKTLEQTIADSQERIGVINTMLGSLRGTPAPQAAATSSPKEAGK